MKKIFYVSLLSIVTLYSVLVAPVLSEPHPEASSEITITPIEIQTTTPNTAASTPLTVLKFDPSVDLQDRNFAEAQSDIIIRGGTFDNSTMTAGGATLYDPQTGHYTGELPLSSSMFKRGKIVTGLEQALNGFQGTAGGIEYNFDTIQSENLFTTSIGDRSLNGQSFDFSQVFEGGGAQINGAHSGQNGTQLDGESTFYRSSARIQFHDSNSETNIAYGFQQKDFQWPNLYALKELHSAVGSFGVEGDNVQTHLAIAQHKLNFLDGDFVEFSGWYRRLRDDYEFDVTKPNLFNLFQHKTELSGARVHGNLTEGDFFLKFSTLGAWDNIESSSLVFGPYSSRSYFQSSILPGVSFPMCDSQSIEIYAGPRIDDTNRTAGDVGVLSGISYNSNIESGMRKLYAEFSQSSQTPGYTALSSNSSAGLFRGNPNLHKQDTDNTEVGFVEEGRQDSKKLALFFRKDKNLTDWTYDSSISPFASRTANNIDTSTRGIELMSSHIFSDRISGLLGYTYLLKSGEYNLADVDASFYALNYARHRFVSRAGFRTSEETQIFVQGELKRQQENKLREGTRTPFFVDISLEYTPTQFQGFSVIATAQNVFNNEFEEVPGVPGTQMQGLVEMQYQF